MREGRGMREMCRTVTQRYQDSGFKSIMKMARRKEWRVFAIVLFHFAPVDGLIWPSSILHE